MIKNMSREMIIHGGVSHIVAYDIRDDCAVQALHAARAYWQGHSDIEALDEDHFVVIVYADVTSEVRHEHK
jgi:hypothetical protein